METPLHTATQIQQAIGNIQQLVAERMASPWVKATDQERRLPNHVQSEQPQESPSVVRVGDQPTTHYTPAFLNNKANILDVAGYVPRDTILDMGMGHAS